MILLKIAADHTGKKLLTAEAPIAELELLNQQAETLRNAGNTAIAQGDMSVAEKKLEEALRLCHKLQGPALSYNKAQPQYDEFLKKVQFNLARTYSSLGWLSLEQTKLDDALEYFVRALGLFERLSDISFCGASHSNLGAVYTHLGLFDKAFEEFEKAVDVFAGQDTDEIKDRLASNMVNIGVTQKNMGLYDQALERYTNALSLLQTGASAGKKANTLNNMALIYCLQGKSQEVIFPILEQSQQLTKDTFELAFVHQIKGMYYARQHSIKLARQEYRIAKKLYSSNVAEVVEIMLLWAELEMQESAQAGIALLLEAGKKAEQVKKLKRQEKRIYSLMNTGYVAMKDYERANAAALRMSSLQEELHADQIKAVDRHHKLLAGYDLLEYRVIHDELTGLWSHKYLYDHIERECAAATRTDVTFSLIMIDIDNFKKVNDTYGHVDGNKVLIKVATILKEHVRSIDIVARYGGEEMLIFLGKTAAEDAVAVAEKLRKQVQDYEWSQIAPDMSVTISLGVSDNKNTRDSMQLIERADAAMYAAKHSGRNRTCLAATDPVASR